MIRNKVDILQLMQSYEEDDISASPIDEYDILLEQDF